MLVNTSIGLTRYLITLMKRVIRIIIYKEEKYVAEKVSVQPSFTILFKTFKGQHAYHSDDPINKIKWDNFIYHMWLGHLQKN